MVSRSMPFSGDVFSFLPVVGVPFHTPEFLHYLAHAAVSDHSLGLLYAGVECNLVRWAHPDYLSEHAVCIIVAVGYLVKLGQQVSFTYALCLAYSLAVDDLLQQRDTFVITSLIQQV